MSKQPAVYILASKRNGTTYVGVTSNLVKRVWEHKEKFVDGFAEKHDVILLVYYELHCEMSAAITREKQIKAWKRDWKKNLIEEIIHIGMTCGLKLIRSRHSCEGRNPVA